MFSSFEVVVRWSSKSSAASVGIAGTVGGGEEIQNSQGVRLQIALVLGSLESSLKRSSFQKTQGTAKLFKHL